MQMDMTYATIPIFNQTRRLYRESHMQYTVTSQDQPQNSPLYAVNMSLDSFIMFNNETLAEQISSTESLAEMEEEEHNSERPEQSIASKNPSQLDIGIELQVINLLNLKLDSQEDNPQPDEKLEESKDTKPIHQTENVPLWTMYFDGSCTRTNAGAGV